MRVVYQPPRQSVSEPTESSGNFAQTLTLVVVLAFLTAGLFHIYRHGGLSVPPLPQLTSTAAPPSGLTREAVPSVAPEEFKGDGSKGDSIVQKLGGLFSLQPSWSRQELSQYSLESPVALAQRTPSVAGLTYYQIRQIVQRYRWEGKSSDGFQVETEYYEIDGTHTLSLEDGVKLSIIALASQVGDSAPAYRSVSTYVNGLTARRVSYAREYNGMTWHIEELAAQANRRMFFACAIFPGETRSADAERVLNSFNIHISEDRAIEESDSPRQSNPVS